ncbi:MAG: trypsin-like peptidase domain-containing protein [Candidatus Acidiferrales bacterium]
MKKTALLVAVMMFCSGALAQQLTKDEKRALELKPGVVLVVLYVRGSVTFNIFPQPIPFGHRISGTGFLYRPDGYIITNGHVVEHANLKDPRSVEVRNQSLREDLVSLIKSGEAFAPIENVLHKRLTDAQKVAILKQGFQITPSDPILKVILANGKTYDGDILQYSPPITEFKGKDVAVIKIPATDLPTVALGDSETVRVQDPVLVIGYPGTASATLGRQQPGSVAEYISSESDLVPSATNGHISAIKATSSGSPVLQTDVAITHGNSGGPAFNENGQVIGIATFGSQEAAGFNFLVPINTAMEFVRQTGVGPTSGPFNVAWAQALDMYDQGKCKASIAEFDNVLQLMPGLPDAAQYRNIAAKCWEDKSGFQRLMETSSWVVYAGVLIALMAIIAVAVRSRGARPVPARAAQPTGAMPGGTRLEAPIAPPTLPAQSYGNIQATAGALSGKTFKIPKEGLLIGRSPKCQVILQDDTVSSEHAWIVPSGNEVVVIDKGSSNGTYVNSVESPKVSKIGLRNGDRIFLGKKGSNIFTYFNS